MPDRFPAPIVQLAFLIMLVLHVGAVSQAEEFRLSGKELGVAPPETITDSASQLTAVQDAKFTDRETQGKTLNINFAHEPGAGKYDGVVGSPRDTWNFVSTGTTAIDFMRYHDASPSTARMRISRHDGGWGIRSQYGIFRGYIYHNCRCVDLAVKLRDVPAGAYRIYVYAHGDAPDQNASIELKVGGRSMRQKATANDGTWRFRQPPLVEGIQYVRFDVRVESGETIKLISHRDGSDYSMFNAIQLVSILPGPVRSDPQTGGL